MNNKVFKTGEIALSMNELDKRKIAEIELFFKKNPKVFNSLNTWILFPDKNLKDDLLKLKDFINDLYKMDSIKLYRGFDIGSSIIAENLGFKNNSKIGDSIKFKIPTDKAISFTSDISVARFFGEFVIETELKDFSKTLFITDELSYLVAKSRNLKPATQKEYILFGEQTINCQIVEKNKESFFNKILKW